MKLQHNDNLEKHFTASALILENNRVLLLYHKKLDVWLYPGGHVEASETPEQALVREVREETMLEVGVVGEKDNNLADVGADVSVLHKPYAFLCERVGDHYHNDLIYLCEIISGRNSAKHDPKESEDLKFFSLEDLEGIKLFPNFKRLLKKVLKCAAV